MERALLGCCLIDQDSIPVIRSTGIGPSDFYSSSHQRIFAAIVYLDTMGIAVDLMSLYRALKRVQQVEEIGGLAYLSSLEQYVMTTTNAGYYAETTLADGLKRKLIDVAGETLSDIYGDELDIHEIIERLEQGILATKQRLLKTDCVTMEAIRSKMAEIAQTRGQPVTGIPSGLTELDIITGGWKPGHLVYVAARPSIGKSAFVIQCLREAAANGTQCDFFSLEMGPDEILERMLSQESAVNGKLISTRMLNKQNLERVQAAAERLAVLPISIEDVPRQGLSDLIALAKERQTRQSNLGLIAVDYIGLIRAPTMFERQSRVRAIGEISGQLKALARELELPVIVCCQLSRAAELQPDARPKLSHLRESGDLEQDADEVIFIHRLLHKEPAMSDHRPVPCEIIVAKQRNGPTGVITDRILFHRQTTRFLNAAPEPDHGKPVTGRERQAPREPEEPTGDETDPDDIPFYGTEATR